MLNGFVLATIAVSVQEVVDQLLGVLVLMNQTVGEVGTSGRVRRVLLVWQSGTGKVWVQNLEGLSLVARVDHSERSGGIEPIPVCDLAYPLHVVLHERIVGSVGVHHSVGPDGGSMEDGALLTDRLLDVLDKSHVHVVVFLEELQVEAVSDVTLQNGCDLAQSLSGVLHRQVIGV